MTLATGSTTGSTSVRRVTHAMSQFVLFTVLAITVLSVLLVVTGHAPGPALTALASGAFGSGYAISSSIVRAIPLALSGLAVALAFRAGLLNIGAEGQLLIGACAATATGVWLSQAPGLVAIPAMLTAATVAGAAWAFVAAELRRRFGVLEVISTIMLNFIAIAITGWIVRGPLQEPTHVNPQSASLPLSQHLPVLISGTRIHVGALFVLLLAFGLSS